MPNRNISNIDLLVGNRFVTAGVTGNFTPFDFGNGRHDLGLNIHVAALDDGYTAGTATVKFYHSDVTGVLFDLIPEEDILTPTDDYPNYLPIDDALGVGKCMPFVQLKSFKRYVEVHVDVTVDMKVTVAYASRSNFSPADPEGAIIPDGD